jgi:hypothetical protein
MDVEHKSLFALPTFPAFEVGRIFLVAKDALQKMQSFHTENPKT